ncbi:type VI secretion system baseplate subunit TssF [Mangrovibacter yixingensis]|uniref:type VI secretion system baseplate subunit TssF n=1 Tax=Mangrovibacter yixingensis TaxID=1529639 RepID=UPI001CFC8AA2|nr:type VI secretion system baseplate subunit TssF [Mangrovibacter yixingensis]
MNRLLAYYQKEIHFLKNHGKKFAQRFPKISRRLGFVDGETEDPHISRLIESFALLTSRIHQRLDDDMPEVTEALLSVLAPQFLRPLPSCCIVMVEPDRQRSGITGRNELAAGMALFSRQRDPLPCQFHTVYPVTLLPLAVDSALLHFDSDELRWQLQLQFQVWPGAVLGDEVIRLYLHGPGNAVNTLYTLLCSEVSSLMLHHDGIATELEPGVITAVGFNSEEALIAQDSLIAPVHILLLDYFWFPQKFSFIDIALPTGFQASGNSVFTLQVVFRRNPLTERLEKLADLIDGSFFRLHCSPAINLFAQRAEPISLTDSSAEYPVIPDTRHQRHIEVWSIETVSVQRKVDDRIQHYRVSPLLESHYGSLQGEDAGIAWQGFRRETQHADGPQTHFSIGFSTRARQQPSSVPEVVTLSLMCTNHALAHHMPYGQPKGDFDTDAPVAGLKISALTQPTRPISAPEKADMRWRFLSQLSLNFQLLSGEHGVQHLKSMLALYNFTDQPGKAQLYHLIQSLDCQPVTARLISNDPHSLARGIELTVTFDGKALQEPEYYLLCSLLDRLLALYAPVNSFTRLTTRIEHETSTHRVWPVRAGKLSWI